ncbi:MAG: ferric reductase-like transmembrane domain-containing protein [Propionibacteriaceae bacterium]|nr:ferric reductase-like transmembrane domain-containing protein [Propionibacteriaceae bacterium]
MTIVAALFGLTACAWALSSSVTSIPVMGQVSQLLGGLALTGFALMFTLATRTGVLDTLFDGLDKAYVVHKWLGIVCVGLVVVHFLTHDSAQHGFQRGGGGGVSGWGVAAMAGVRRLGAGGVGCHQTGL